MANCAGTGSSQRQRDCLEFEASLSYLARLYVKTKLSQAMAHVHHPLICLSDKKKMATLSCWLVQSGFKS